MERLKDMVLSRIPYRRQILPAGLVYQAQLLSPLTFGKATPTTRAAAGTRPAPDSVLTARLVTPLDSEKTPRGTAVEAVLIEPVFSSDGQLILPVGAKLRGEVTFAKRARAFRRNGQLRFLFENVEAPDRPAEKLLASLYAVDASKNDHLALDEGGASITNTKARFIAPALSIVALNAAAGEDPFDDDIAEVAAAQPVNTTTPGLGRFLGFGLIGPVISQISRPVGLSFAFVGVAQTVYSSVFAKGREVSFPADTAIHVRLAPKPGQTQ
jgi:hypothetical protein